MGAGKSVAASLLQQQGCSVFDADAVLHQHWFEPNIQADLQNLVQLNQKIERADVKTWLNYDVQKLRQLEATLYPHLSKLLQVFLTQHQQLGTQIVVLDIPLLFEKGWDRFCTRTICMVAPLWVCRQRVFKRPHITPQFYHFISQQHWPQAKKAKAANYIVSSLWGRCYVAYRLKNMLKSLC